MTGEARIGTLDGLRKHLHTRRSGSSARPSSRGCGLCDRLGEREVFRGDPARQVGGEHFRHTAGRLIPVHDFKSALAALTALTEIVEEGEGGGRAEVRDGDKDVLHPDRDEVAHYYRFQELQLGRRYQPGDTPRSGPTGERIRADPSGVRPMRPDPRPAGPTFSCVPPGRRGRSTGDGRRVAVLPDGPYVVYGGLPLRRKRKIVSSADDALTWKTGEPLDTEDT